MDVRTRILEEATRLFAARGYEGTSLQSIAEAVGMRKASLLYHHPTKEALHRAVLEALLTRWNESLPRLLEAAARKDRLDAVLDETLAFFIADPDRARLLLRESIDHPDAMRELLSAHVAPWLAVVADAIRREQADGHVRSDVDPEAFVVHVIHLVVGATATARTLGVLIPPGAGAASERLFEQLRRLVRTSLLTQGDGRRGPPDHARAPGGAAR